ncbi:MAG TPA: tRNA lysidine(34) synthetase TilS [Candidatus Saccharimonadia bacterium]|jgi:tRNA(Ile)-lysidine synthase|nr:tRNA lysidine(34) synthetase TilS [Candidatus Saccharimonadia bacterium]
MNLEVVWPETGRYILAVSGGADSMALLDMFARAARGRGYELVVAHFNHGLRPDAALDQQLAGETAARLGLLFETADGALGTASEASARAARHGWLERVRVARGATAILTAHHQDDLLETSLLNLARGTGRLGLAPMADTSTLRRPLIGVSRAGLRTYAKSHKIAWREDPTNADLANPRNFLRHQLLPAAELKWRESYLELIKELNGLNKKIDQSVSVLLDTAQSGSETFSLARKMIQNLSPAEVEEIIVAAARHLRPGIQLDARLVNQAARFAQAGEPRKFRPLRAGLIVTITRNFVNVTTKAPQ